MDALGGTNDGKVNFAVGVDSKGKTKVQLKYSLGFVTVKTTVGEDGKVESVKVELGTSKSIPGVRFKKDLAETETSVTIPYSMYVRDNIDRAMGLRRDKECP